MSQECISGAPRAQLNIIRSATQGVNHQQQQCTEGAVPKPDTAPEVIMAGLAVCRRAPVVAAPAAGKTFHCLSTRRPGFCRGF